MNAAAKGMGENVAKSQIEQVYCENWQTNIECLRHSSDVGAALPGAGASSGASPCGTRWRRRDAHSPVVDRDSDHGHHGRFRAFRRLSKEQQTVIRNASLMLALQSRSGCLL
ncbi:hypothetical protein KOR42_29780 [Thalassoglobus neptunius]|uniref:Uncharacterized protein n=1 Tax=Thalassoglobus neptunius TaxID=1938619 RepID=A0A5C5WR51_9PLAN|nr:hypothetical protein KOR42_29780 [Thalassoglobus neptunius]